MVTLHPAEKEWKTFVFDGSAKQQIKELIKCEKLISIGSMAPIANKFFEAIKSHCDECCNEKVRQWFEYGSKEEGVLHCYLKGVLQAKLALAVAVAAKAVYIKIPKVGDDSKNKIQKRSSPPPRGTSNVRRWTRLFVPMFSFLRMYNYLLGLVRCSAVGFHFHLVQVLLAEMLSILNNV